MLPCTPGAFAGIWRWRVATQAPEITIKAASPCPRARPGANAPAAKETRSTERGQKKCRPEGRHSYLELAATYSRTSYTSTTIGNAAFDGRVRNGIGSDHSFTATSKFC